MRPTFITGDCLDVLKTFPNDHFHACVTDPPAGISFMGKKWDSDRGGRKEWIEWLTERMREVVRVLKPGAHAVVWALPRTSHWTATALEESGLQVRDCLYHCFGQGFPKSADAAKLIDNHLGVERRVVGTQMVDIGMQGGNMHADRERNVVEAPITAATSQEARAWEGWGTALKPAVECWWLARKPLSEPTIAENLLKHGTGALNIDASRIRYGSQGEFEKLNENRKAIRTIREGSVAEGYGMKPEGLAATEQSPLGRWPTNFLITHDERCVLRGTKKVKSTPAHPVFSRKEGPEGWGTITEKNGEVVNYGGEDGTEEVGDWECVESCPARILDGQSGVTKAGGQPRFRGDGVLRNAYGDYRGGRAGPGVGPSEGGASRFFYCGKANAEREEWNKHMTLKPLGLMAYILGLVAPKGGRVVDPFCGSGTTNLAALRLNLESVGIDAEPQHIRWAEMRCAQTLDQFAGGGP